MRSFSLSQKIFLMFFLVLIPVLVLFSIIYQNNRRRLENLLFGDLDTISLERAGDLLMARDKNESRMQDFASDFLIISAMERESSGQRPDLALLTGHLSERKLPLLKYIKQLSVLSVEGKVLVSTDPGFTGKDMSMEEFFLKGKNGVTSSEVTGYFVNPMLAVSAPVYSSDKKKLTGVIAGFLPLPEYGSILSGEHMKGLGPEAWSRVMKEMKIAIYLLDKNGMLVAASSPRDKRLLGMQVDTPPVRSCLSSGKGMSGFYKDYQGRQVAGASVCFGPGKWVLVSEVDKDAALAPIERTGRLVIAGLILTLALISAFLIYFLKAVISQLWKLTDAAGEVARGNYDISIPLRSRDEIGVLSGSFNDMARSIKEKTGELKDSEARLANAQSIAHIGSWEWEIENDRVYWSDEMYRIFGIPEPEFGGNLESFLKAAHPDDRRMLRGSIEDALDDKKAYSVIFRVMLPDGEERIIRGEGEVIADDSGRPVKMTGVAHDITEHERAEQALKLSEEKYKSLVDNAIVGVYSANLTGEMLYANQALANIFGYDSPREFIAAGVKARYKKAEDWENFIDMLKKYGRVEFSEAEVVTKDGEASHILYTAKLDGEAFSGMVIDITARKKAEEEVQRLYRGLEQRVVERTAELEAANRDLEAFSYSVAHDLRTPLRLIDGFTHRLLKGYSDALDEQGREYMMLVRGAGARMSELLEDLLSLSRVTRVEMHRTMTDLSAIARSIAEDLKKAQPSRNAEFIIKEGMRTEGDAALIRDVLENLMGNAWKFTGKNEYTRIEFGEDGRKNDRTVYFVRDNGVGFDMSHAEKLFEPFQRLHRGDEFPGTGIGLATVQRIILRHGGKIWAESEQGKGATFYFTL